MRIGILCNGRTLAAWQRRAIEAIGDGHEFFLLAAEEPRSRRQMLRHGLYYALNLAAIRNRQTRPLPFPDEAVRIADRHEFTPAMDGGWSAFPDETLNWIAERGINTILKFGLGLLRVPPPERLAAPILSYHHGDPRSFRGRPAGFHEIEQGAPYMGQVVQILSNRLDAGEVLAFAESRVAPHSYRRTLLDAYALSPALLPQALSALESGRQLPITPAGSNYRLPSNGAVVRFVTRGAARQARRIAYGAMVEKRWRVSLAKVGEAADPCEAVRIAEAGQSGWRTLPLRPPHRFHADPFFFGEGGTILLEAMHGGTGKGELLRIDGDDQRVVRGFAGHISYPASIEQDGRQFVIPEICDWSSPTAFEIVGGEAGRVAELDIDAPALLDPTLLRHDDHLYLFANRSDEGPAILRLWVADQLFGPFREHPQSPIRTSIRGGRMAGPIHRWPAGLIRTGQDFRGSYGDGIVAFRIAELGPERYREEEIGSAAFAGIKGPHTIDIRDGQLLFDWYEERITPMAGIRRLLNRL